MFHLFEPIAPELELVRKKIKNEFELKAGNVSRFIPANWDEEENYYAPALLLLSARVFNPTSEKMVGLAAVVQFIYLATFVHGSLGEDDHNTEGPHMKQGPQLLVLVGDYLLGKFYVYLCEYDALEMLSSLSEVICQIHEGGILRCELLEKGPIEEASELIILEKEYGAILSEACRMGARLAKATKSQEEALVNFGHNFGIALGLKKYQKDPVLVENYLESAWGYLQELPKNYAVEALEKLILQNKPLKGEEDQRLVV